MNISFSSIGAIIVIIIVLGPIISVVTGGPLATKTGLTKRGQSLVIVILYTILIVGTFVWSGRGVDLTVYDRVVIDWGGMVLPVTDLTKSEQFYREFLDLPKVTPPAHSFLEPQRPCFGLPTKKPLCLSVREAQDGVVQKGSLGGAEVVVNVKSNFPGLYELMKTRQADGAASQGSLSPIGLDGDLEYFTVTDPDGNRIIFRRTRWLKLPVKRG